MKKSRMFHLDKPKPIKTWNPYHGCRYACYKGNCWAAQMAKRLQAAGVKSYRDGFKPTLVPKELRKRFGYVVVFVVSMGDLFGMWVPDNWIYEVIKAMRNSPNATFFLETKNPIRYFCHIRMLKESAPNTILSTTIETNRYYNVSEAPTPLERYVAMRNLDWPHKHVSIEPIMDFDPEVLVGWIREINPQIVSVGYDNYKCYLPEPTLGKTMELIKKLEKFTKVERKVLRERRS